MNKRLVIIHTTPATVESLKNLALSMMDGIDLFNIVDDSILFQLKKNGGNIRELEPRWARYVEIAERDIGADCVLNACSSIGELVEIVQKKVAIPIVRIDERMAEEAVRSATKIGVAATVETTLNPTMRLLRKKAKEIGKRIELENMLVNSAYQKLVTGDKEGHDKDLAAALERLAERSELVVLAQASMARVLSRFSPEKRKRFLTSPELGMRAVADILTQG
jgi:aspartate/glutamate racemase